jgi:hypothetical protein
VDRDTEQSCSWLTTLLRNLMLLSSGCNPGDRNLNTDPCDNPKFQFCSTGAHTEFFAGSWGELTLRLYINV